MVKISKKTQILYGSIFILFSTIALYFYPKNRNTIVTLEPQIIKKEIPKYSNTNKINFIIDLKVQYQIMKKKVQMLY